jgi:hypothetical protein
MKKADKKNVKKQIPPIMKDGQLSHIEMLHIFIANAIVLAQRSGMTYENLCDLIGDNWD